MKNLKYYYNLLRKSGPSNFPFNQEELLDLIAEPAATPNKSMKLIKKYGIYMSILIIAVFSLLQFNFISNSDNKLTIKENQRSIINQSKQNTTFAADVKTAKRTLSQNGIPETNNKTEEDDGVYDLLLLVINNKELEKIGIQRDGDTLKIEYESIYDKQHFINNEEKMQASGYPTEGIYRAIKDTRSSDRKSQVLLPYTNWDMKKSEKIYPVLYYSESTVSTGYSNDYFGLSPLIDRNALDFCYGDLMTLSREIIKFQKESTKNFARGDYFTYDNNRFVYAKYFLPVIINNNNTIEVIWYPKTEEFVNLLPVDYHIKLVTEGYDKVKLEKIKKQVVNPQHLKEKSNSPMIKSTIKLNLTISELENLGIIRTDSGFYYIRDVFYDLTKNEFSGYHSSHTKNKGIKHYYGYSVSPWKESIAELGYDTNIVKGFTRTFDIVDTFSYKYGKTFKYGGWNQTKIEKVQPVAVTQKKLKKIYNPKYDMWREVRNETAEHVFINSPLLAQLRDNMLFRWSGAESSPLLNTIIPVSITLGSESPVDGIISYGEISFWFILNEELISKLPYRYRDRLNNELKLLEKVTTGQMNISEACNALKGEESLLDLCSSSCDAIKEFNVFPNPARKDKITISFNLLNTSKLKIELFTTDGHYIKLLKQTITAKTGENQIEIRNLELMNGIYIISLSDDKNCRITKKIIVQN